MTKNPFLNALAASLYIVGVVSFINFLQILGEEPETILIPMAMLSLFVLSAAMMAFLFFFQPVQMYLDGEKRQAVNLFLKTLAVFAFITIILFSALFLLP
jgi:hypothetical protein